MKQKETAKSFEQIKHKTKYEQNKRHSIQNPKERKETPHFIPQQVILCSMTHKDLVNTISSCNARPVRDG